MNAHIKWWIKSLKIECLDHFMLVGGKHLDYLISEHVDHYHHERPHQMIGNRLIICGDSPTIFSKIICDTRLCGLLRHYHRAANIIHISKMLIH